MIIINEGGKRRAITKMVAIFKQGVNQAITSNGKTTPWVVAMKAAIVDREKEAPLQSIVNRGETGSNAPLRKNVYDELNATTDRLRARYAARLKVNDLGSKVD